MFDAENPSCTALMDGVLRYVTSDAFAPADTMPVEAIERLLALQEGPADAHNMAAAPSFERAIEISEAWLPYGGDYAIDTTTAHTGQASLKLTITPEQRAQKADYYTGAQAKTIHFKRPPKRIRLSAWHKTETLTGEKNRDFLLFVYITYREGGRYTLRLPLEPGTHDWQFAETTWQPEKDVASAVLYVGMMRRTGTAWIDDVYFGEAPGQAVPQPAAPDVEWRCEPATLRSPWPDGWVRVNDGEWKRGGEIQVSQEGASRIVFKEKEDTPQEQQMGFAVHIDLTPPTLQFGADPAIEQEGGVYYAHANTAFTLDATDALSGVAAIEVAIDDEEFRPYAGSFTLPAGEHTIRCHACDHAGNETTTMSGDTLTGGATDAVRVTVKP